jgi:hypothetical protein
MPATLAELEARLAALETDRADYQAVLVAVNALSQQTRERLERHDLRFDELEYAADQVAQRLTARLDDTNARVRSIEENVAEIKDLLIRVLDRR